MIKAMVKCFKPRKQTAEEILKNALPNEFLIAVLSKGIEEER